MYGLRRLSRVEVNKLILITIIIMCEGWVLIGSVEESRDNGKFLSENDIHIQIDMHRYDDIRIRYRYSV